MSKSDTILGRKHLHNFLFMLIFCVNVLCAQKLKPGCGFEYALSFNGHGSFISPYAGLNASKFSFKLGPLIQKRYTSVNGVKLTYSHLLARRDKYLVLADDIYPVEGPFRLNVFTYLQYIHNGFLSYNRTKEELLMNPETKTDWNAVRLSTVEAGAGFELVIKFSEHIRLRNFLGLSFYYHTSYLQGMYHEKAAPSLVFGTGINIPRF